MTRYCVHRAFPHNISLILSLQGRTFITPNLKVGKWRLSAFRMTQVVNCWASRSVRLQIPSCTCLHGSFAYDCQYNFCYCHYSCYYIQHIRLTTVSRKETPILHMRKWSSKRKHDAPKFSQLAGGRPCRGSTLAGSSASTRSTARQRLPGCHLPVGCSFPRCRAS